MEGEASGSSAPDFSRLFRERCLRIPRQLLKNDTSVVQSLLAETAAGDSDQQRQVVELPTTMYV